MKYLLLFLLCGYLYSGSAQTYPADEAATLKSDNELEAIIFSGKSRKLKTLYKKLPLFPNLSRIIIEADFDTAEMSRLLWEIRTIENIEEIDISFGKHGFIPAGIGLCDLIRVLKIYNTSKLNTEELEQALGSMAGLDQVSWINNSIPLPDIGEQYAVEYINTSEAISSEEIENILENTGITELTIGIDKLETLPSLENHPKLETLKIMDLSRFKDQADIDYLHMEDEYSETIAVENSERSVSISYSGASHTLDDKDIEILVKLLPDAEEPKSADSTAFTDAATKSASRWGTLTASPAPAAAMPAIPLVPALPVSGGSTPITSMLTGVRTVRIDTAYLWPVDTTWFDQRYDDAAYYYLAKFGKKRDTVAYVYRYMDKNIKPVKAWLGGLPSTVSVRPDRNMVRLLALKKEPGDSSNYTRLVLTNKYLYKPFPELYQFRNYEFMIDGFKKTRQFKKQYILNKRYSDIRIIYNKGDESGLIELKGKDGYTTISFDVVTDANRRRAGAAIRRFGRTYDKYLKSLHSRRNAFNDYLRRRYQQSMRITTTLVTP